MKELWEVKERSVSAVIQLIERPSHGLSGLIGAVRLLGDAGGFLCDTGGNPCSFFTRHRVRGNFLSNVPGELTEKHGHRLKGYSIAVTLASLDRLLLEL